LLGAVEATREKLIVPVLIGQEAKIRATAARAQLDLSPLELISTKCSEAAAVLVVAMDAWTRAIAGFELVSQNFSIYRKPFNVREEHRLPLHQRSSSEGRFPMRIICQRIIYLRNRRNARFHIPSSW
jgi:hypothetical protein